MKLAEANIIDLSNRRQEKQEAEKAKSFQNTARAIQDMKDDITVALNTSIDALVEAGMSEDKATLVVMTYLSDLVMAHDVS